MRHPPLSLLGLTPQGGQRQVGGLAGAAPRRKDIGGAQRSAQAGQKSAVECKDKSRPDWALNIKGPRGETRA